MQAGINPASFLYSDSKFRLLVNLSLRFNRRFFLKKVHTEVTETTEEESKTTSVNSVASVRNDLALESAFICVNLRIPRLLKVQISLAKF